MHMTLCVCALVPSLDTSARLSLLIHYREARKPTNTGQLAARCFKTSTIGLVGDRAHPLPLPLVRGDEQGLLLFPAEGALSIAAFKGTPRPVVLVVPDGNWRQAAKMRHRVPGLAQLPCVVLPECPATNYRLRAEPREDGLATMEAIAYALGILEGPHIQTALLRLFKIMVERTLWLRGALCDHEVSGGIPSTAVANDPRGAGNARPQIES